MKFLSELTNKAYESVEALENAEKEFLAAKAEKEAKDAERKTAAKEVEEAFKAAQAAEQEANDKLKAFCDKYGAFHYTMKQTFPRTPSNSLIDFMLSNF